MDRNWWRLVGVGTIDDGLNTINAQTNFAVGGTTKNLKGKEKLQIEFDYTTDIKKENLRSLSVYPFGQ